MENEFPVIELSRRDFLRDSLLTAGAITLSGCVPRKREMTHNSVYTIQLKGLTGLPETIRKLSPEGYFFQAMLDNNGDSVLFWGSQPGEVGYNVWRCDLPDQKLTKLTNMRAVTGHPFWSSDSKQIVYFSTVGVSAETKWRMEENFTLGRASRNLWIMDADGGNQRKITAGSHVDERPCISPDGKTVVFVSDRSGKLNLWAVNTSTGELRQLTKHNGFDYRPVFSPDGSQLAFFTTNSPSGIHDLCIMNWPGGETIFPVRPGTFQWIHGPFWCADGKSILIHGPAANEKMYALWILNLSDGHIDRIKLPAIPAYAHGSLNADRSMLIFDSGYIL